MKRFWIMTILACLVLSLAACGGTEQPDSDPVDTTPTVCTGFSFTYNGVEIAVNAPAAEILAALGEPKSYSEETSCAFSGLDKTYYYGSFYLCTYPLGEYDYVYSFWFVDDSIENAEGLYIGAPESMVESAYGAESYNGANAYILTRDKTTLTVIIDDGVVKSIQYTMDLN